MDKPFDAVLFGGLEQVLGAAHVGFLGDATRFPAELKRRAEVDDRAAATHGRGHAGAIAQIAAGNFHAIAEEALRLFRRAAEHAHRRAPAQETGTRHVGQ